MMGRKWVSVLLQAGCHNAKADQTPARPALPDSIMSSHFHASHALPSQQSKTAPSPWERADIHPVGLLQVWVGTARRNNYSGTSARCLNPSTDSAPTVRQQAPNVVGGCCYEVDSTPFRPHNAAGGCCRHFFEPRNHFKLHSSFTRHGGDCYVWSAEK